MRVLDSHCGVYLLALFSLCSSVWAQTSEEPFLSAPYGECNLGYWSSNRNLDDQPAVASAQCLLNWKPQLSANVSVGVNLRLGLQDRGASEAGTGSHRLREAYADSGEGSFSARLGRQILASGRADRMNPTDWLAPRDFTLLATEDDTQRLGSDAVKLRYAASPAWQISAVAAQFAPHITPQGSLPANAIRADNPTQTEWALKLDYTGSGVDGSVSYFDGYDRFVRYRLDLSSPKAPVFRGDYERVQAIGADFAVAQGAWTWRGEFAHATHRPGCDACPVYERSVTRAVMGADRDFWDTMNVNVQFFATQRSSFQDPTLAAGALAALTAGLNRLNSEYGRQESGMSIRLSDRVLNDRLKWEISAVLDFTGQSSLLRPRVSYAFNDRAKLNAGIDLYLGDGQSYFGALTKNSLGYLMLGFVF